MAGKKILIVDDQDVELRSLETVLRKTGYDTITATSAEIALEVLEKAEGVDLVVTDVCMGELSGIDLVSLLPNNMPALVMTGHPNEHDLVHLKREGVVDYIEKPCAPEHLLSLLDSIFQTQKTYCDLERKVMVSTPCDHDFEKVCGDFDHTFLDYVPIILRADSVQDTAIKMYEYSPGIVILTEKTSPEDACKIVRRVSSTYPFTNIISLGSVLTRGETGRS